MTNIFAEIGGLNARDQAIAQLVLQMAFHVETDNALVKDIGLDSQQLTKLKEKVGQFERDLSNSSPTLSSLLAKTTKSTCCS
ncbi:hypothetical protein EGT07_05360 [Herbaspirillum sp. HC18]|nr:hypothetical protein EGT07_05360 [Herbaspirillum sp. HC18]